MSQVNQFVQQLMQPLKRLGGGRNPRAYTQGLTPYRQKQWQQAVEYFTRATTEQPDHAPSHFKLGMSHFRLQEYEAALAAMTRALELDPSQKQWQEQLDQVARHVATKAKQSPSEKEQTIRDQIERLDNPSAMLYNQLAHSLRKQGKWWQEIEALKSAIALEDDHPTWFYRLGEALEVMNLYQQAAEAYGRAIGLKEGEEEASATWHYRQGYCFAREGHDGPADQQASENAYAVAIEKDIKLNAQRFGIGVFHQQRGLWPQACKSYELQLFKNVWDAELHHYLGLMYIFCNKYFEAEKSYKQALAIDLQKTQYHFLLGYTLERQDKNDEAALAYEYAVLNHEFHTPYWFHCLGLLYKKQGNYKKAVNYFLMTQKSNLEEKRIEPIHVSASNEINTTLSLKNYLQQFENPNYADEALLILSKQDSQDANKWHQMGLVYEKNNQWDLAADAYEKSLELIKVENNELYYRLGCCKASLKDYLASAEFFKKINLLGGFKKRIEKEIALEVISMDFKKGSYSFKLNAKNNSKINSLVKFNCVVLKHRERIGNEVNEFFIDLNVTDLSTSSVQNIVAEFSFNESDYGLDLHYWDLFVNIEIFDKTYGVKSLNLPLKKFSYDVLKKLKYSPWEYSTIDDDYIFHPYITASGSKIAFLKRPKTIYDESLYFKREQQAITEYLERKEELDAQKAWLIFEKYSQTAQDNGYFFFKYAVKKRRNVYYVIDKNSPDFSFLEEHKENVVDFMSKEHMLLILAAEKIISSETRGHGYAWRRINGVFKEALMNKKYVFLQHGVTALKTNGEVFAKKNKNFAAEKVVVTSELEKNIFINNFGYSNDDLIISGFSRWDGFVDHSHENNKIFVMPTWRNWLEDIDDVDFIKTNYYKNYKALIESKDLEFLLFKYDLELNFYLHPKIIYHLDKFKTFSSRIKMIDFGEVSVRDLLMQSKLLITDYSSVAWDFLYLGKPVIFYHFDLNEYAKYQGAYIDLKTELPGKVSYNEQDLIDAIKGTLEDYDSERINAKNERDKMFSQGYESCSEKIYNSLV